MCNIPKTCLRQGKEAMMLSLWDSPVPSRAYKESVWRVLSHPWDVIISQVMCSLNNGDSNMENTLLQLALLSRQIFQKQNSKMTLWFELIAKWIFNAKDWNQISARWESTVILQDTSVWENISTVIKGSKLRSWASLLGAKTCLNCTLYFYT